MKKEFRMVRAAMAAALSLMMMQTGMVPVQAATPDDWLSVLGTYVQADGNQYNAGKLQLLPLDDGSVLFELDVMKGSESEGVTEDFRLPGTLYVEEDGTGTWEGETENGDVHLSFVLDGETVTVSQTGALPVSVEGEYAWLEEFLEVTPEAAGALLEGLPTAATSLNSNNGEYRLEMSDLMVDGWFYDVKALFTDTGATIGEFLVAEDLSAVYRIDTETPMLIYGSADAMMQAERIVEVAPGEESTVVEGETEVVEGEAAEAGSGDEVGQDAVDESSGDEAGESTDESGESYSDEGLEYDVIPLVDVVPSSASLRVGDTATLDAVTPGGVPATITSTSDNPDIATVDEQGRITAMSSGTAILSGTITVEGSEKPFSAEVTVWDAVIQALDIQTQLAVGQSVLMKAQVIGASDPIVWGVSDLALADIDASTGDLTVKQDGLLTLTAQAGTLKREWMLTLGTGTAAAETTIAAGDVTTAAASDGADDAVDASAEEEQSSGTSWIVPVAIVGIAVIVGFAVFTRVKRKKAKP